MQSPDPTTFSAQDQRVARRIGVGIGLAFVALGLMGLIPLWLDPSAARAPLWLVELAAGAFVIAGISLIFETLGQRLLARLFSFSLLPILAITGIWALFDGGGTCSVSTGLLGIGVSSSAPDWACRASFIAAGAIALVGVILALWLGRRQKPAATEPGPAS